MSHWTQGSAATDVKTTQTEASEALLAMRDQLAASVSDIEFERHPELVRRYGPVGRMKSRQDAMYHIAYLAEALRVGSRALFADYVAWAKVMLAQRRVLPEDFAFHLACLAELVRERIGGGAGEATGAFIDDALAAMPGMPEELPTFLHDGAPLTPLAHQYLQALLRAERHLASGLVLGAVDKGAAVREVYLQVFQPAQREIGRLWQQNRISVAQEHYCTAATQLIMSQLYPRLFGTPRNGRVLVACCVSGDLHELGARMVADFFEMEGWSTYYTGASTPEPDLVRAVVDRRADVLAISATMTYHVSAVERLVKAVRQDPGSGGTRILVGGYPFNRDETLWKAVGADGWARDAQEAVGLAEGLLADGRGDP